MIKPSRSLNKILEPVQRWVNHRLLGNYLTHRLDQDPEIQAQIREHLLNNFCFWQERGVHATPVTFDQPIPHTGRIDEDVWKTLSDIPGVRMNANLQCELLSRFAELYKPEYEALPRHSTPVKSDFYLENGAFESVDGEMLYCMIRALKPQRIFEIGSGNTTYLSAYAVRRNQEIDGVSCELVAFEPNPNETLRAGFPGLTRLEEIKAQQIPLMTFGRLGAGDILFIDSSHVLKVASDVQYLVLEVFPRLRSGVHIHVHDIFLPSEYPRAWVMDKHRFWNEQYFLQAFLAFNDSFDIVWAGSYMHLKHSDKLAKVFDSYDPKERWPGSLWMKRR